MLIGNEKMKMAFKPPIGHFVIVILYRERRERAGIGGVCSAETLYLHREIEWM